jgi:hypothetical protein
MQHSQFKVGDRVRRRHAWDGSSRAGMPIGLLLTIAKVYPGEPFAIIQFVDGRTEFEFNPHMNPFENAWEREAKLMKQFVS